MTLWRPEASLQLLVRDRQPAGRIRDLTHRAKYRVVNPKVAAVTPAGLVEARRDGLTEVEVRGVARPSPVSFENEIIPVLSKAGCNAGSCHGKAEGKNGFKLSVFGFDPEADRDAIVNGAKQRRAYLFAPERSLLLLKATGAVPHAGGKRFEVGSAPYRLLRRWLAEGGRYGAGTASAALLLEVDPPTRTLAFGAEQQLRVWATGASGARRCVTAQADFISSSPPVADVDSTGWVRAGKNPGEAAILVRYMGQVAIARMTVPRPGTAFARPPQANFIDGLVWTQLQRLGIQPSSTCDDATFLRRAYLDTIGTLPTAEEARAFLRDCAAEKQALGVKPWALGTSPRSAKTASKTNGSPLRPNAQRLTPKPAHTPIPPHPHTARESAPALATRARLVEKLLNRPEYPDYWAMRWSDLLRVDKDAVSPQGAVAMTRWLRRQFAENRPYDELVRDILLAQGDPDAEGPAGFYKALEKPEVISRSVSQLFLGVRIECAQCHHHPSERWGQNDYFALAGFFTGVGRKGTPEGESFYSRGGEDLKHPRTGKVVPAHALGAPPAEFSGVEDRRKVLADWIAAPDNAFFARSIANRLWAHYMGRGLVEPVDDMRATNPAVNEPLLDALAKHIREAKFDLKAFTRTLLTSRVYQLSAATNRTNVADDRNFSHASARSLPAEVLLDAISQATGVPEKFEGWPGGYRAIQVWDNRLPSYFFQIFGRPIRASVCECERSGEPSVAQALHLMNSPEIGQKIHGRSGTARRLAESSKTPEEIIEELFLATLSRPPRRPERAAMLKVFADAGERRAATEDVLWALLNTKEFVFNH